ncbi:hypothetical protein GALMADRAFT_236433 [Galerina marginata CBS 339.88]|uniref:Uncharacterized protein n=1 Tax=Galerina marginata (strain CBS 339.88) TaxID=685588 RepID=A0A067TY49_GALM3|nr:hypothetical protein GALMADRAFT_236433 [Galerina marginata CBS 339.88]
MDSPGINEEEIDLEALQAQIDLSMSFAQNIISSWVEPSKFPTSSRRKNLEQELIEYMKKPPRLGVGATMPDGVQSMTRETARLRGKLAGSKRTREEEATTKPTSDDEGESRAGVIKKKYKLDPFDAVHGKKKKKTDDKAPGKVALQPVISLPTADPPRVDSSDEIEDLLNGPDHDQLYESPIKRGKEEEKVVIDDNGDPPDTTDVLLSQRSTTHPFSLVGIVDSTKTPSTPSRTPVIDVSLTKTPVLPKPLPPQLLKVPLLNLTGRLSDHDSDAETATGTPSASPKKKRKRRKKKKNHAIQLSPTKDSNPIHQTTGITSQ